MARLTAGWLASRSLVLHHQPRDGGLSECRAPSLGAQVPVDSGIEQRVIKGSAVLLGDDILQASLCRLPASFPLGWLRELRLGSLRAREALLDDLLSLSLVELPLG